MTQTMKAAILVIGVVAALAALVIYDDAKNGPKYEQARKEQKAETERAERHKKSMEAYYKEHPTDDSKGEDQIRVVRENHRGDDSSREYIFRAQIKALGERCDSVDRAIMGGPGEWEISCAPGYEYRLSYDANGKPTRAQRAQ